MLRYAETSLHVAKYVIPSIERGNTSEQGWALTEASRHIPSENKRR
jgi:hypothetical protein